MEKLKNFITGDKKTDGEGTLTSRCGGDEDGSTGRGNPDGAAGGALAAPGGAGSGGDATRGSGTE